MRTPFSFDTRASQIERLQKETHELLIIGGGITGAAVARDASLRGISCALVEADDFASATSSGSSKLIHGGIRYLENYEFKLVYHAIRERELLLRLYSPLVQRIEFVFPTYHGRFPPRFLLNMGLSVYDSFSFFRERHQNLNRDELLKLYPILKKDDLSGGIIYADSFAEDFRLVIELIKAAVQRGANCISRLKVKKIREVSSGFEIEIEDRWEQKTFSIRARSVINCAGPFSDDIKKMLGLKNALHLTQGVHFLIPREKLPIDRAFVLSDPEKKRILFAIPWKSATYLGTTDTNIKNVRDARARREDLEYVLSIAKKYFDVSLKPEDVFQSWAAVRPLIQPDDQPNSGVSNSEISREHRIDESPKNFFHILGGKITSHRLMAKEALDKMAPQLGWTGDCKTEIEPLHSRPEHLPGTRLVPQFPNTDTELSDSIQYEMALAPIDYLKRRSSLFFESTSRELFERVWQEFQSRKMWTPQQASLVKEWTDSQLKWDQGYSE